MELYQLNNFQVAAVTGNYSAAAKQLQTGRSSVRQSVRELENELGVSLFYTDAQNITLHLTDAGHILLQYADRILEETHFTEQIISQMRDHVSSEVTVAFHYNLLFSVMPILFRQYLFSPAGANARVRFIMKHHFGKMMKLLSDGTAELAFSSSRPTGDVHFIHIAKDKLYALLSKDHPLSGRSQVYLRELKDEPLILSSSRYSEEDAHSEEAYLLRYIDVMFQAEHIRPHLSNISAGMPERIAYVQAGLGYAISSFFPVDGMNVVAVEIENPYSERNLYMLWSKNRPLSPQATVLRDYCIDYFKRRHDTIIR